MSTMTCQDCRMPVARSDAHLRSVSLELVAFCVPCMAVRNVDMVAVAAAVDAVLHAPEFVVAAHSERVA